MLRDCWFLPVLALISLCHQTLAQTVVDPALTVTPVITSGGPISRPVAFTFIGPNDLLVCSQHTGQVRRVTNGVVSPTVALDLPVATANEQGLLNIELDPNFSSNQFVYVYYTRATMDGGPDIDHRVNRYTWNGSTLTSQTTILILPSTPGDNHNGGILRFGPPTSSTAEQKLHIVIGDLNRTSQLENFASGPAPADTASILRVNPDGSTPTGAEAGPFFAVAGSNASLQRLYAYGIRNSFGLDFDPVTGHLWQTENGPGEYDEVNLVLPAFNSGWRRNMGLLSRGQFYTAPGFHTFSGVGTYSDPEFSWFSPVAVTAIHFARGTGMGVQYLHNCFVGDGNNGRIYRFPLNPARNGFVLTGALADLVLDTGDSNSQILFGQGFISISDIRTGPDGALYVNSLFGNQIYRIAANAGVGDWTLYE